MTKIYKALLCIPNKNKEEKATWLQDPLSPCEVSCMPITGNRSIILSLRTATLQDFLLFEIANAMVSLMFFLKHFLLNLIIFLYLTLHFTWSNCKKDWQGIQLVDFSASICVCVAQSAYGFMFGKGRHSIAYSYKVSRWLLGKNCKSKLMPIEFRSFFIKKVFDTVKPKGF